MNPFSYPKIKHQRKFKPKQYKRYQSYKRILRLEFSGKCVYCQMPSSLKGYEAFGVDHYRPQSSFKHLSTNYGNLFYCCNSCNSAKGSYWPKTLARETTEYIPNPCDHRMFENLRYNGAIVDARTHQGKLTVRILDLNDPAVVVYREFVINSIDIALEKQIRLKSQKYRALEKIKKGSLSQNQGMDAINEIDAELAKIDNILRILSGST